MENKLQAAMLPSFGLFLARVLIWVTRNFAPEGLGIAYGRGCSTACCGSVCGSLGGRGHGA